MFSFQEGKPHVKIMTHCLVIEALQWLTFSQLIKHYCMPQRIRHKLDLLNKCYIRGKFASELPENLEEMLPNA